MIKDFPDSEPWVFRRNVLPQHTDHAGVMWHGSYLNLLEEARIEALSLAGITYKEITMGGLEMPVISMRINYLSTLSHGDEVILKTYFYPKNKLRWPVKTIFFKSNFSKAAEAWIDLVFVKKVERDFRILRDIPSQLLLVMDSLIKGPLKKKY